MSLRLFIAGTDTGIGKTYISVGLLKALNRLHLSTLGIKPIASGSQEIGSQLYNEDALLLQSHSSITLPYNLINPFAFRDPVAPHIAAQHENKALNLSCLNQKIHLALNYPVDVCLVEGVGGWYVPLNDHETMADFVFYHHLKVILVVGIRLGCINHGILTLSAIQQDGIPVIGWIANCLVKNMDYCRENIDALEKWLNVPLLGCVDYQGLPEDAVDVNKLLL